MALAGGSVVEEVATCTSGEVLHWLAMWAMKARQRVLDRSMEDAWRQAFSLPGRLPETSRGRADEEDLVTPTITQLAARPFEMDSDSDLPF